MPPKNTLAHRNIRNTNLPYVTNVSPTSTEPCYITGSQDILTGINGYAERRPGFSAYVESTPTTWINLQRTFPWDRFDGTFYVMFCDILANGKATVYKYLVGVDTSAVLIYTEAAATNTPYDFTVSNNTLYFSNGTYIKKWDPVNGVTNWGISIGSSSKSSSNYAGAGTDVVAPSGISWTNPGNIVGSPDASYATVALLLGQSSDYLQATSYGFGVNGTISGIQATIHGNSTANSHSSLIVTLLQNGVPVGTPKNVAFATSSTDIDLVIGGSSDLWGTSWSPQEINASGGATDFGVQIQAAVGPFAGSTFSLDSCQVTVFFVGGPVISVSGTSGTMSAATGYQYVQSYGNSNSGHISSPTPPSTSTGAFTSKLGVLVAVTPSTDSQVNQIHTFRTTDSASGLGGQSYFEIPGSPIANSSATVTVTASSLTTNVATFTAANNLTTSMYVTITGSTHNAAFNVGPVVVASASATQFTVAITHADIGSAADAALVQVFILDQANDLQLNIYSLAPTPTFNDPPPPFQGMVYFSGRIWGFTGNKVWFSGLEEITVGVPEESFPSGIAGNFWAFDQPVNGLGVAGTGSNQILLIFCGGRIWGISGNSLDTFQRFNVSFRRGCRNRTAISMMGGMCAWYDTAGQVWATDGSGLQELSIPIRPDFAGVSPANVSMTFHTSGVQHWLVVSTREKLYVYDVDTEQWMPPWSVPSKYVYSGETSAGNYQLMSSTGTKAITLGTGHNDQTVAYTPKLYTNLFSTVPDFGNRFSYIASGIYDEPSRTGQPWFIEVDRNANTLTDLQILTDDDPFQASYTSIYSQKQPPDITWNRPQGTYLLQDVFATVRPRCRWVSITIIGQTADDDLKVYGFFVSYKVAEGS